jgi:hypothetical protein
MLKRIRLFALSVFFLLYTEGLLHANPHYSFEGADDFAPAPGLLYSDVLRPAPGPAAAAPPTPRQSTAAKNAPPPAKRKRVNAASVACRKSKKKQASLQPVSTTQDLNLLREDYRTETGGLELFVTSTGRTERGQAAAMYHNFVKDGSARVIATYRNKRAVREIAEAFEANRRSPRRAIDAMAAVITRQVDDGIYISNHLRGKAVDLRSWGPHRARLKPLRQIARSRGWRVLVEPSHVHVDLS